MACLAIIASTPWALHTQFTVARGVALAQAHRARRAESGRSERGAAPREARQERRPAVVGVTVREATAPPPRLTSGAPGGAPPPARLPRGA